MEPILQRIDSHDYDMLLAGAVQEKVDKGKVVFSEGEAAEKLYLIQKGVVRLYKDIGNDKEITIFTRREADGFGEIGLFSGKCYSNTAKAMKSCTLYAISREHIENLLSKNGKLSLCFTRWVAETLEVSKANIRDFLSFGSEGAVASIFIRYANMYGVVTPKGIRIMEPIMMRDISKYIGISRETVSRIVNKWKDEGLVENDNKYFLIKNISYFRRLLACEKCGVENCAL